ncbi:hypothetical protein BP6252_02356 [Coleophoma cylindrospora]|uniref:Secreted protein n=1 Tax=Coleophoma cylindrospora TaxID=1849047 RepID=A0A3D8SEP6_9HELO|nr:hypothetical protein BP6252_02356 [Coleophoma cylindrospora]
MQFAFQLLALLASFCSFVFADLHSRGICVDLVDTDGYEVYNEDASKQACEWYLARNTGTEQWDQCPDCYFSTDPVPHCRSDGWHIGGDELYYYCQLAGADTSAA